MKKVDLVTHIQTTNAFARHSCVERSPGALDKRFTLGAEKLNGHVPELRDCHPLHMDESHDSH